MIKSSTRKYDAIKLLSSLGSTGELRALYLLGKHCTSGAMPQFQDDGIKRHDKHEMHEAAVSVTQHTVLQ
jgi:hypothetical protein